MPRQRLSAQQQAIQRGSHDPNRKALYQCHAGPQYAFQQSDAEEVLYGGAAGGGKSYALRAWGVRYCMENPGARVVLFRRTYKELEDTHLLAIQIEVPKSIAMYSAGKHDLVFRNGSIFHFRFCERDADVRSHDTAEYDAILFDELTAFSDWQYTYLLSRCRSTKPWWPGPRIRAATNPGNLGHEWVYRRWVEPVDSESQMPLELEPMQIWTAPVDEGGMTRQFIPAKITDNPTLMAADPHYVDRLRAMSEEEYRAKALGDWNVFTGQFFTRFNPDVHVIQPFDIPLDWDRFMCVDYGFNAPWACLWLARPPATQACFVYRELYGKGLKSDEQIFQARQIVKDTGEKIRAIVLDPSMFNKVNTKGERVNAIADDWQQAFPNVYVARGVNDRVPGWRLMREMLDWQVGPGKRPLTLPRLQIFNTCKNLVRTLPKLIVDEKHVEDINSEGEDHAADALRYGLMHAYQGNGRTGIGKRVFLTTRGIVARTR